MSLVVPIYKNKGSVDDIGNYRPISLLLIISKIMEKCMAIKIGKHFEENNLFTEAQHGIRQGHGTVSAIAEFVSRILTS